MRLLLLLILTTLYANAEDLQSKATEPEVGTTAAVAAPKPFEAFGFADFTWLNGNSRQTTSLLDTKYVTGQFLLDANYVHDFNQPSDHTLDGASEMGRTSEVHVQQLGIGGDFHYSNVRGRLMTQLGMYSQLTPNGDASPGRGQWNLANAYRYVSEANGGYHFDVWNGINLDVGIFMSYIGLCSYYNFENWAYQPSYVSANTPWFFNGVRLQMFPSEKFKVELWLVNGWQSYGMFNDAPGIGAQFLWRPNGSLSFVSNDYYGYDTLGTPSRLRAHSDNSVQVKYYDTPKNFLSKAAVSLTLDAGCESGGGVSCTGGAGGPEQSFLGFMLYHRVWLDHDLYAVTLGGGAISNPGRYLVILPPINGATAGSGSAYFSTSPGTDFHAWDASITFDYLPNQYITFRVEFDHRQADTPYFVGAGGITPPTPPGGIPGNQGPAGSQVAGWQPDLVKSENRINAALLVRL